MVCEQCGTRQDPGQAFCESCNAVLRWGTAAATTGAGTAADSPAAVAGSGAAVAAAAGAGPTTVARPAAAAAGQSPASAGQAAHTVPEQASAAEGRLVDAPEAGPGIAGAPAGTAVGPEDDETVQSSSVKQTEPLPAVAPATAATPTEASAPAPAVGPTGTPVAGFDAERARALLVPVADPQERPGRPPTVAPVLPGRPAPVRPEVRAPGTQDILGGIACPWCGTPNSPERHFCSRCAMSMAGGPANAARRPWWRRMLDHRNREQPWAGDRPRLRRTLGRILRWVVWAAVAALVATGLFHVGDGINATRDHFAKRVPVAPDSVSASRSYPQHGPGLAFDKFNNTWWGPGITGTDQGEWIEARFQQPVNLLDVGITAGESTHADTLAASAIPHRIEARITTDDGKVTTKTLSLDQASGFQLRGFRFRDVASVRFTLVSAYNTSATRQVAIAEIEFFGPSQAGSS